VKELDPYGSSSYCSVWVGEQRPEWGRHLRVRWVRAPNRQLNAAINLYMRMNFGYIVKWVGGRKSIQLRMEGASQREWWNNVVLPSLLGGCVLTGGKRSDSNELVRGLHDAVKPKLYAYDRYNDTYLRIPT